MSKFRAYKFTIKTYEPMDLNKICKSKYEYLLICKKNDNTLQGLIRFSSQKTNKTVSDVLLKIAEIEPSSKSDKKYKELFLNDSVLIFEQGVHAKQNQNVVQIIEEKDKIIKQYFETKQKL